MTRRDEVPDTLNHGFTDGELVRMPDGTECRVVVAGGGRAVIFDPVDPAPRPEDGGEPTANYRLGSDGSIIRHPARDSGPRLAGSDEPSGWTLADLVRLDPWSPQTDTPPARGVGATSLMSRYRERLQHQHGWEVELQCPWCGLVARPTFRGWKPSNAIHFGDIPTIYVDLDCPRCGTDLKATAGEKLVGLFSDEATPRKNRRLIAAIVAFFAIPELGGAFLMFFGDWRRTGAMLMLAPAYLVWPISMWFNWQITSIRYRCACGEPAYKFMGLLGRSYCYRCSTCGSLLRMRD